MDVEHRRQAMIEDSGSKLIFFAPSEPKSDWYDFDVAIETPGMTARLNVPHLGPTSIAEFFSSLKGYASAWNDAKKWASIEGNLSLSANIDRTGHIACEVLLQTRRGRTDWMAKFSINIESGAQLSKFVADLRDIFD